VSRLPAMARAALIALLIGALPAVHGCARSKESGAARPKRVALAYIAPHELINQVVRGFREGLAEQFPGGGCQIYERHANGDLAQLSPTINALIAQRPDLMATITTPASQVALKNLPAGIPLCFLAVTDPVGAGLVESLERPGRATGVSDLAPFASILRFVRDTLPKARRIGLPYNPEEQPAVFGKNRLEELAPRYGFQLEARAVVSRDDLDVVVRNLAQNNDCLLIGTDNAMFEAAPQIVKIAREYRKPVFAGDSTSVKAGAVGGVTVNYYEVGKIGAAIAARILRGEKPSNIPVYTMPEGFIELNLASAERVGIRFDPEVVKKAKTIYR
jgi:putative ABC transport system substrate-binding protein